MHFVDVDVHFVFHAPQSINPLVVKFDWLNRKVDSSCNEKLN
jgi:hypothetical protein